MAHEILGQRRKKSVSQFSTAELRDLFRLDQESLCQTHDLSGCDCGGKGISSLSSGAATPKTDEADFSELSDAESDYSLPDPLPLKASEVDMEEQERSIRQGTYRGQRFAKNGKGKPGQKGTMHHTLRYQSFTAFFFCIFRFMGRLDH